MKFSSPLPGTPPLLVEGGTGEGPPSRHPPLLVEGGTGEGVNIVRFNSALTELNPEPATLDLSLER
jgi:hypothetical protein